MPRCRTLPRAKLTCADLAFVFFVRAPCHAAQQHRRERVEICARRLTLLLSSTGHIPVDNQVSRPALALRSFRCIKSRANVAVSEDGTNCRPVKMSRLLKCPPLEHYASMNTQQNGIVKRDTGIPTVARVAQDTIVGWFMSQTNARPGLLSRATAVSGMSSRKYASIPAQFCFRIRLNNNLIANDCVLLPSKPEHHGDKSRASY